MFFAPEMLESLGAGRTCDWGESLSVLTVTFGSSPTFGAYDQITILAGVIQSADGESEYNREEVLPPLYFDHSLYQMSAALTGPQDVGPCDTVALDVSSSSGGFGRPFTIISAFMDQFNEAFYAFNVNPL